MHNLIKSALLVATALFCTGTAAADTSMNCPVDVIPVNYRTDGVSLWYAGFHVPHHTGGASVTIASEPESGVFAIVLDALDRSEDVIADFNSAELSIGDQGDPDNLRTVVCVVE